MKTEKYTSKQTKFGVVISLVSSHRGVNVWAEHRKGQFKGFMQLSASNTAVVQNFGYDAEDFDHV
jgi:hypothetical protein